MTLHELMAAIEASEPEAVPDVLAAHLSLLRDRFVDLLTAVAPPPAPPPLMALSLPAGCWRYL